MNIIGYVKRFGNKTFRELRFSDVDGLILAELAYINFHLVIKKGNTGIKFSDISEEDLKNKAVFVGSVDAKNNRKLLAVLIKSTRYKDVIVQDVVNKYSVDEENQFFACTFVLPTGVLYISYRGTDTSLTGWKEDFLLSVYDKIKAQVQAERYMIKELAKFEKNRFYLGGHSKGGNLAFYAALNIPEELTPRLIGAYSYDGPGFRQGIREFKSYKAVRARLVKFRTFNNVIGSIFTDVEHYKVVYSIGILGGHDPFGWQIRKNSGFFRFAKDVSTSSKAMNGKVSSWLDTLSMDDRMLTVEAFFRIFDQNETIYDLFKNLIRNIRSFKTALSIYTDEEKLRLKEIFKSLFGFLFHEKKMRKASRKELKANEISASEAEKSVIENDQN